MRETQDGHRPHLCLAPKDGHKPRSYKMRPKEPRDEQARFAKKHDRMRSNGHESSIVNFFLFSFLWTINVMLISDFQVHCTAQV